MVVVEGNEETKQITGLCLFHFGPSLASQKVRACLEAKHLKWKSKTVSLKDMTSDWYFAIHPQGLVPALVHDGVTHVESADIMVYLDEAFPETPLRPATAEGKKEVQSWLDLEGTIQKSVRYLRFGFVFGYFARRMETDQRLAILKARNPEGYAFHKQVKEGQLTDELMREHIERVHDALQKLQARLKDHEWLVGDRVSLAEYCWGPVVMVCMEGLKFPFGRYPAVRAWYERLLKDEGYQKGVIGYGGASGPPRTLLTIKSRIQEFLGYSVTCVEKEVKPNWVPTLVLSVTLPLCFAFLPFASITAATGVSAGVISACLGVLWAGVFYTGYKRAHTATKGVFTSQIHHMRALLTKEYGTQTPMVCEEHPRPKVVLPDDVLVRVHAASINPIDVGVKNEYAKGVLQLLRKKAKMPTDLPLILGRDCSGVVEAVGASVSKVNVGDKVWAALAFFQTPGSLAEYVVLKEELVSKKPDMLNHVEAASLPYVTATTWGALVKAAGLSRENAAGKRVLILGGTGGVGSFAIQLVKAWGGHVTTSCSASGRAMVEGLGADEVVDYTKTDLESALKDKPRFDVVLDTRGPSSYQACLNLCRRGGCVVTIVSPALHAIDKYGFFLGIPKAAYDLFRISIPQKLFHGRSFRYGFAAPAGEVMDEIAGLVEQDKIKPVVEKVYSLEEGNEALEHVRTGHARGKTVVACFKPAE